jgi:hypothetical protein
MVAASIDKAATIAAAASIDKAATIAAAELGVGVMTEAVELGADAMIAAATGADAMIVIAEIGAIVMAIVVTAEFLLASVIARAPGAALLSVAMVGVPTWLFVAAFTTAFTLRELALNNVA